SLHSHLVYVKEIEPGQSVRYGGTFTADRKMRVGTVPVGYGDGYPRSLSGKGFVLIGGKRAPILGRVCMDQFMVDLSELPQAAEGDAVVLIGRDGQEEITAGELGALSGRFNYELVCDLSPRVPRVYLRGGKLL
ncbi:MAG: alanine racemase, partial [Acetatifactor sp.]|nr:alanine racemase [Acetatifactor sp.]